MRLKKICILLSLAVFSLGLSSCAVNFYKQNPRSVEKITDLKAKISDLERQREKEREKFEEVKSMLEKKFQEQIANREMSFSVDERGLAIILSDDILFDSGRAEVKQAASPMLDKMAEIINKEVSDKNVGISGHTDNVPIKYSNWKSNWELSTARAINVLHCLVGKGILPGKLSATGYGEYRPIASNEREEGRSKNRRVEIVILPEFAEKRQEL